MADADEVKKLTEEKAALLAELAATRAEAPAIMGEAQARVDQAQRVISAMTQERDEALLSLRGKLDELTAEEAKRWVDVLELPWDGLQAIPGQLKALMGELKGLRAKQPTR